MHYKNIHIERQLTAFNLTVSISMAATRKRKNISWDVDLC